MYVAYLSTYSEHDQQEGTLVGLLGIVVPAVLGFFPPSTGVLPQGPAAGRQCAVGWHGAGGPPLAHKGGGQRLCLPGVLQCDRTHSDVVKLQVSYCDIYTQM